MKKTLIALGIASGLAGSAMAQSSVTLFGGVDAMVGSYKSAGAGAVTKLNSGGLFTPRLGFRGTEDLGGGLAASFWLEAQIAADSGLGSATNTNNQASGTGAAGGLTFNRRSTVSLHNGAFELRVGRDYTPSFWNLTIFDPFGTIGVAGASSLNFSGTSGPAVNLVRSSNSIGLLYNAAAPVGRNGFYGQAQVAAGEAATGSAGNYAGVRAGYAQGAWNAAIGYGKTTNPAVGDMTVSNAGASYRFGIGTLSGNYSVNNSGVAGTKHTTWLVGALIPVGVGEIRTSYVSVKRNNATGASARQFGLGYAHHLSKRTAVYAAAAHISNKNGATFFVNGGAAGTPGGSSRGYEVGVKHTF